MNLSGWANGAWADGSWVPESWGEPPEVPDICAVEFSLVSRAVGFRFAARSIECEMAQRAVRFTLN